MLIRAEIGCKEAFKPLKDLAEGEEAVVVVFAVDPDQLSALVGLANFDRPGVENVFAPMGAGCYQIGIYAFREAQKEMPRAVYRSDRTFSKKERPASPGQGRPHLRYALPTLSGNGGNVDGSFLKRDLWRSLAEENGEEVALGFLIHLQKSRSAEKNRRPADYFQSCRLCHLQGLLEGGL